MTMEHRKFFFFLVSFFTKHNDCCAREMEKYLSNINSSLKNEKK